MPGGLADLIIPMQGHRLALLGRARAKRRRVAATPAGVAAGAADVAASAGAASGGDGATAASAIAATSTGSGSSSGSAAGGTAAVAVAAPTAVGAAARSHGNALASSSASARTGIAASAPAPATLMSEEPGDGPADSAEELPDIDTLFKEILQGCGLNNVLRQDLWIDSQGRVRQIGPDDEPWGRITTWGQRPNGDFTSISITCRVHGGSCRRVFSKRQLEQYGLGDGQEELLEWLLLAVNGRARSEAVHSGLPKPLPLLMMGGGGPLDLEPAGHGR